MALLVSRAGHAQGQDAAPTTEPAAPMPAGSGDRDPYLPTVDDLPLGADVPPPTLPEGVGEVDGAAAAQAVTELAEPVAGEIGSQIFFDAAETALNPKLDQTTYSEFVAIGAGTLIAADTVNFDNKAQVLQAKGRVVVLNGKNVFLGESVTYNLKTTDFKIGGATMLVNDAAQVDEVMRRVLGLTTEEIAFESARKNQLTTITERRSRLRAEARRQAELGMPLSEDLVDRYARLLEQDELVTAQENPVLARMPEARRERFKRRREFWDRSRKGGLAAGVPVMKQAYFKLTGDELVRTDGNDYSAQSSLFTLCRCDEDEAPAWGFRADSVEAQIGGYADLHHPVLEIKGIPVLYLPYLKIPLKDERQSGFLMPTLASDAKSGNIYSQPVYFDLGKDQDATLTTDVFERRGTRLGVEYRVQQREHSGWTLNVEGIRDRLWMAQRGVREDLLPRYREGLDAAAAAPETSFTNDAIEPNDNLTQRENYEAQLSDPHFWGLKYGDALAQDAASARANLDSHLAVPSNTWRGSYSWRGVTFLAPRLSLVSNAEVTTDHRYTEDLYVPNSFDEAFYGGTSVKAFSPARAQFHLDGKDYYAGLGTRYGDNYLLDERFEGQQEPLRFKVQSRKLALLPEKTPVPIWAQVRAEQVQITEFRTDDGAGTLSLGDGNWRRMYLDTISPIVTDSIVHVSHFSNFETRYIEHAGLLEPRSKIRSWSTGIELSLPIDGKGELPKSFSFLDTEPCGEPGQIPCDERDPINGHHLMDWRLRFSVRPQVVRRGPYVNASDEDGGSLAYYGSDRYTGQTTDKDVPEEERMHEHQRVSLTTSHIWRLFKRDWKKIKANGKALPPVAPGQEKMDAKEKARRELLFDLDRQVTSVDDVFAADQPASENDKLDARSETAAATDQSRKWLIDRYQLADDYFDTPAEFNASVAYDFLKAKERREQRRRNAGRAPEDIETLVQPWDDPELSLTLRHEGFQLANKVVYNIYAQTPSTLNFGLTFPKIFESNLALAYDVERKFDLQEGTTERSRTRSATLATSLIPPVTTYIRVERRVIDLEASDYSTTFRTAYGFKYDSSSECWGLQFLREKDYGELERQASYLLQLSVTFMGQQRYFPDMSPGVTRKISDENEES